MKSVLALVLLGLLPSALAQEPSPTESYGCEPHEDHWHCEGPRTELTTEVVETVSEVATTAVESAVTTAVEDHDDHEDEDEESESLAPSPTESVGCSPHGDHWHCEGPATTAAEESEATTDVEASPTEDEVAASATTTDVEFTGAAFAPRADLLPAAGAVVAAWMFAA